MNDKIQTNEAPIDNYSTIGDFTKGSSFTKKADRALVTHPVAIQKVKDFFKKMGSKEIGNVTYR